MKLVQKVGVFVGTLLIALGVGAFAASPASAVPPLGPFRIVMLGKCLDVEGGPGAVNNGAHLQLYDCLPSQYNQRFYLYSVFGYNNDAYQIRAAHSGKCLDVEGVSYNPGARIQQYDCIGPNQTNQVFRRVNYQGGVWQLMAVHSGDMMVAYSYNNGSSVIQGTHEGGSGSWWAFLDPI